MLLTLKNGRVEHAEVYSDAIDADLAEEVRQRLTGCRFGSRFLCDALQASDKEQVREVGQFILEQGL